MSRKNSEHKWSADRPAELPEQDKLGRTDFAERLAREISAWRQKDSLVISINGEWGSGKTTVANLVLHYIRHTGKAGKNPIVARFNPWQWSGQEKLLEGFFHEIRASFRREAFPHLTAKKLEKFWDGLKVLTVSGGEIAAKLQESLVAAAALLAGTSGVASTFVSQPFVKAALGWFSVVLLGIASVCAVYAPVAEWLAAICRWKTSHAPPSLEEVRSRLRKELEKLDVPVLIMIDDIDRLSKEEMRLLVQLVKANADFPNVVYLLLYQKTILAGALGELTCENGQEFLKKIVQIELELPLAPEDALQRLFRTSLAEVLSRAEHRWEKDRWSDVFEEGIWPYFRTPRDIKRFFGVLDFYYSAHIENDILNVNPIDLILLETLRMFDPVAYEAVGRAFQKQRNLFLEALFHQTDRKDRLTLGVAALLERPELAMAERERLEAVLYTLFPQARDKFTLTESTEQGWLLNRRMCHPRFFRRYLQLGGDSDDISATFLASLFKIGNDREKCRILLKDAFQKRPFASVMEYLRAAVKDTPHSSVEPLIFALFDLSEELPQFDADLYSVDAENQVVHYAIQLLRQIDDENDRASVLRRAALGSTAITGPALSISLLRPDKDDKMKGRVPIIPLRELDDIQTQILPQLWSVARSGKIWTLQRATFLFYILSRWAEPAEFKEWLANELLKPDTARAFLRTTLNVSQVSGHTRGSRKVYTLIPSEIEHFIDLKTVASAATSQGSEDLDKAIFDKLQVAIENKATGKASVPIYVISRDSDGKWISDPSDSTV